MTSGEIVILKTTGEKVHLIAETDRRTWKVRRPSIAKDGAIEHLTEEFFETELESIEDFADRTIAEMKLKAHKQKELFIVEQKIEAELQEDDLLAAPAPAKPQAN